MDQLPSAQDDLDVESAPLRILAADLWPGLSFGDYNDQYRAFLNVARPPCRQFVESLLLYDEVVIPTESFLVVRAMLDAFGEDNVIDLLDADRIRFIRVNKGVCYVGNGRGLSLFDIQPGEKKPSNPGERFPYGPIDEAIEWALYGFNLRTSVVPRKVLDSTHELNVESSEAVLRDETYKDVLQDDVLRTAFWFRNRDMDQLTGIGRKEVRTYDVHTSVTDEIGVVLSIARANLELRLAVAAECADGSTALPIGHVFKSKGRRRSPEQAAGSFAVLCEIADLPDIGELVLRKEYSLRQILNLRDSRDFTGFRSWFHQNCRKDSVQTGKAYADLLRKVPRVESFPMRVLRFLLTSAFDLVTPVAGSMATSAIDSFFLDKWFRGRSPKFFIDQVRDLAPAEKPAD